MFERVVSSAALPIDAASLLPAGVELRSAERGTFGRDRLLAELATATALIATLDVRVDEALLAAAPRLRIVANVAVGVDNVDLAACHRRGVVVTNTPGVLTEATADFTFALMLAATRRVLEGDALARSGAWSGWSLDLLLGAELGGATLGLVGFGRIGQAVARRALGFGLRVLYAAPRPAADTAPPATRVELCELLAASDVVSLHCPLTAATHHLMDGARLSRMRPGSLLVNTARGGCVDEAALVRALELGRPAAAALDVFEAEPTIHPGLVASDRVVLAPHLGSATIATRRRMATMATESVAALLSGRAPTHQVAVA